MPAYDDFFKVVRSEWPSFLQWAAGAINENVRFVQDMIENVTDDLDEDKRLKVGLKTAVREDLKVAIAEAKEVVKKAM